MLIIDATPQGHGWFSINDMVRLASRLLEAPVDIAVAGRRPPLVTRIGSLIQGRSVVGTETESCLLVCASPADLLHLLEIKGWRRRFRFVAAWVIDSFWLEWIPRTVRLSMPFDHLFVTGGEDVDDWHRAVGIRPTWLPWGTDVLALGSGAADRPWDLTRVGRQPPDWEDDLGTAQAAKAGGIRFHPRPAMLDSDLLGNHLSLMKVFAATKFLLAFSNLSNPTNYTHPTRDYITGRWVDALGCGAVVAGCAPRGASIDSLLWPGATLELGSTGRSDGLAIVAHAVGRWKAEVAAANHAQALVRLDWRHRFRTIAEIFGETTASLSTELALLQTRCDAILEPPAVPADPPRR